VYASNSASQGRRSRSLLSCAWATSGSMPSYSKPNEQERLRVPHAGITRRWSLTFFSSISSTGLRELLYLGTRGPLRERSTRAATCRRFLPKLLLLVASRMHTSRRRTSPWATGRTTAETRGEERRWRKADRIERPRMDRAPQDEAH
jgi:hypothetical protein